jgi:hypothetical protein
MNHHHQNADEILSSESIPITTGNILGNNFSFEDSVDLSRRIQQQQLSSIINNNRNPAGRYL